MSLVGNKNYLSNNLNKLKIVYNFKTVLDLVC